MGHIFISYSRTDAEYARRLADILQSKGFETWIDARLEYGSHWPQELQEQLDSCEAFIVIMTPRAFASEWVQSELQRARRKSKPVFPLLLEGDEPWLSVESTQFYDVRGGELPDERFYSALRGVLALPQTPVQPVSPKEAVDAGSSGPGLRRNTALLIAIGAAIVILALGAAVLMPLVRPRPGNPASASVEASPSMPSSEEPGIVTSTPGLPMSNENAGAADFLDSRGVAMRFVPAGNFMMGSDNEFDDEKPVHSVYLDDFYIDKYEVTNALYRACVEKSACQPPSETGSFTRDSYYEDPQYDHYPVVYVKWEDARAYCRWRGMGLPTEAQWEKAARGIDGRSYPWGENIDSELANYGDHVGDSMEVGQYEAGQSPYGVYDMAGNVWEWVADWYSSTFYLDTPLANPVGPPSGEYRVLRGGSWHDAEQYVRTSNRGWNQLEFFYNVDFGFRCAMAGTP